MSFRPNPGDELIIGERTYSIAEHPAAPGMAYGQSGRRGTVYKLVDQKNHTWALKVFLRQFREPRLVGQAEKIRKYYKLPGLRACERDVLTSSKYLELIRESRELTYSVLMPWVDGKTWFEILAAGESIPQETGLQLAGSLIRILLLMEERGLAHCDLSGPNVIVTKEGTIELVDLEEMYSTDLSKPEVIPGGSPGYSHKTSPEGLWNARSDRFAGAILIAEMLGWSDERVRKAAWGEGYFNPDEMQTNCESYHILDRVLNERWGKYVAEYFERAWRSESLMECATFAEWMAAIPESVPGREEVSISVKVHPLAAGGDFNKDKPELDEDPVTRVEEIETETFTVQMDERVWICPVCEREVDIQLEVCPFCEGRVQDNDLSWEALGEGKQPQRHSILVLPVIAIILSLMLTILLGSTYLHNRGDVRGTQTAIAVVMDKVDSATETTTRLTKSVSTATKAHTITPTLGIGSTMVSDVDGMVLMYVPAGTFLMGSTSDDSYAEDDEFPQHEVYLNAYWIDRTEVTNAQYRQCVEDGVCPVPTRCEYGSNTYGEASKENHPVACVNKKEAHWYCEWAGRRLPTEAEWEKAARGIDGRLYPWGDGIPTCKLANYIGCGGDTDEVGMRPDGASPYGVLDMAGNVCEWASDYYADGYYDSSYSGYYYGVLRGGSCGNYPHRIRATYRLERSPLGSDGYIGFRCATSP